LEDHQFGVLLSVLDPWEGRLMQKPAKMTTDELAEHLSLLTVASREDLDELLTDLLCHVYRTKDSQNS
jgi:predicted ArsR family transcriptional regulator